MGFKGFLMAKKNSIGIYLIGMAVIILGAFLPLTASKTFGFNGSNVITAITDGTGDLKVASILALAGAIAGIIFSFSKIKGFPAKLVSLIVSIAGGIYMVLSYLNLNPIAKGLGKAFSKIAGTQPSIGLFLIIAGWVIAIIGYIKEGE